MIRRLLPSIPFLAVLLVVGCGAPRDPYANDPVLRHLRAHYETLRWERAQVAAVYGPENRSVLNIEAEMRQVEQMIPARRAFLAREAHRQAVHDQAYRRLTTP